MDGPLEALDGLRAALAAQGDPGELDADSWLELLAETGRHHAKYSAAVDNVSHRLGLVSAHDRLLRYLRNHVGETVGKDELAAVAGISEWARRIRELRVEHGWPIASGATRDDLRPGEYRLEHDAPDEQLASDWRTLKTVRNMLGSGKARMLAYLQAVYPRSADKEQLSYVAKISEWPRRVRELAEEGWQIVSSIDDPALAPGEYRLASFEQLEPRAREAIKLRHRILDRDGYCCTACGRSPTTDRVQLQVHHVVLVSEGGTNDPSNLVTLCKDCHAGRHALHRSEVADELINRAR